MAESPKYINGGYEVMRVLAKRSEWDPDRGVQLAILKVRQADGLRTISYATQIELREKEEGRMPEPILDLGRAEAQFLMDQLWDCGLRPSEGTGSAGAMAATEKHLQDMQNLTFRLLDNVAPPLVIDLAKKTGGRE